MIDAGHASASASTRPRSRGELWMLVAGPVVWALHFLLSYITVAIHCAKVANYDASLGGAATALWIYAALALLVIVAFGVTGWRRHRHGESSPPHDAPTPADRHRFLGLATLLLCALSFVAVIYAAFAIAVIGTCR